MKQRIDTVQAQDCYDPRDFVLVHKVYLLRLQLAARRSREILPAPREITHAYELDSETA